MDPFSVIAVLGAKYGVKKAAQALFGEGAEAELAEALVGLLQTAEQSHERLLEIERRLDVLIGQRYQIASGLGLRYLQQAMLGGRSETSRHDDLSRAESHLIEAAEASASPLQRALCEHLLIMVRFARRDESGASDSQVRLDFELGEAVTRVWELLHAEVAATRPVQLGEVSLMQFMKHGLQRARNIEQIRKDAEALRNNADVELTAVNGLLADATVFADMLGLSSPTRAPRPKERGKWLVVDAVPGEQVKIGGITCTIESITRGGRRIWDVRVHLSSRRRTAVSAGWVAASDHSSPDDRTVPVVSVQSEVRPGDTVQLNEVHPESSWLVETGDWDENINVNVSGMVFQAARATPRGLAAAQGGS